MSQASISRLIFAVFCSVVAFAVEASRADAGSLLVGAASSMRDVLIPIGESFARSTGDRVRFSFGSSVEIVQQAKHGAPFDAVVTADRKTMDILDTRGLLRVGSRVDFLSNTLDLIVPRNVKMTLSPSVTSPEDLLNPRVHRIAICQSGVPAGRYALELLEHLGLREKLRAKFVMAPHVRATLSLVAQGAVDAGFVYGTDALTAAGDVASVFRAGRSEGLDIRYVAAVLAGSNHIGLAETFVRTLQSEGAWQIFKTWGFRRL